MGRIGEKTLMCYFCNAVAKVEKAAREVIDPMMGGLCKRFKVHATTWVIKADLLHNTVIDNGVVPARMPIHISLVLDGLHGYTYLFGGISSDLSLCLHGKAEPIFYIRTGKYISCFIEEKLLSKKLPLYMLKSDKIEKAVLAYFVQKHPHR